MRQYSSVTMGELVVPATIAEDSDDVVVALETARASEEVGDLESASKWLHRAAAAARHQGRPERAGALSRAAARLARASVSFEKKPDEQQVLSDFEEDEFSEKTIVETAAQIAEKGSDKRKEPVEPIEVKHRSKPPAQGGLAPLVDKPTPVAPLTQSRPAVRHAIRVGVRRTLGGNYEARPLGEGESPTAGEQEALLVPTPTGSKLS
jgi:hypothetical protein